MAEFTPISSQEEFDALIKDRIERAKESARKEFADYEDIKKQLGAKSDELKSLNEKLTSLENEKKEIAAKLSASETASAKTRIALEAGLPYELCDRLTGTNEEEMKKDAETLKKLFSTSQQTAPLYTPGSGNGDERQEAFKKMLSDLK